jgi:hypothetical protein
VCASIKIKDNVATLDENRSSCGGKDKKVHVHIVIARLSARERDCVDGLSITCDRMQHCAWCEQKATKKPFHMGGSGDLSGSGKGGEGQSYA